MKRWHCIRRVLACMAVLSVLGVFLAPTTRADVTTLTDLNSTVTIDPTSQAGAASWVVDGTNQLFQQWFWYRIGDTGGQSSIDTIGTPVVTTIGTEGVDLTYQNDSIKAEVEYDLTGGALGSHTSDLSEVIRLTNVSSSALTLHFFQYSDFDLNGSFDGQTVNIHTIGGKAFVADQQGAGIAMTETVATPGADRWEANIFGNTLDSLNSGATYNLNDAVAAGPGDATWAFQWDRTLQPGSTFLISKDKQIRAIVPEPSTLAIAGLGALGLIGYGLRRRRA